MPKYIALETELVSDLRSGGIDANAQPAERAVSGGTGNPCRHCLRDIPQGAPMLILAHRPFPAPQPYAEVGPIFLCGDKCLRGGGTDIPEILTTSADYLIKGYNAGHRIRYGTGAIVKREDIEAYAQQILQREDIAYLHVRSARNNCYQLRVERS